MLGKKSSKPAKSLFIGGFIFILFILLRVFFAPTFSSVLYTIAEPFWNAKNIIFGKSIETVGYTESKSSLLANIKSLERDLYNLQVQNFELGTKVAVLSNPSIMSTLGNTSTDKSRILAKVISKPPYSPYDSLVLGQGKNAGIVSGADVYIGSNILIGKISEVDNSYSKVILFSSGSSVNQVDILRTGENVILSGEGGGNFDITLPKDFDIVVGDSLVDTSVHQNIMAKVYFIDSSSGGSFKKVYARIPINFLQSEWVFVSMSQ